MKFSVPAVTSMILESHKSEFIEILRDSIINDPPFAGYPGTLAILSELDLFAFKESLPEGSLCKLLDSIPTDGLTLSCVEFLIDGCGMGEKAADVLKAEVSKQVTPLVFKLIMMVPENRRSEIAKQVISSKTFDSNLQDGIRGLPRNTNMQLFVELFVTPKQDTLTFRTIDHVFSVVSSLNVTAWYRDLTKHFASNPDPLIYYLNSYGLDRLLEKLESFPPELVDEFLILLLQSDDYMKRFYYFNIFVAKIAGYQEKSKYICSGEVVDATAKRIFNSYRSRFLEYRSNFERVLMKSEYLGTAEETSSFCRLLNSLTQDELSIPLAKRLFSHCHRNEDKLVEFLVMEAKKSTWDPGLFELMQLLPIERRAMLVEFFKADPVFVYKFVDKLVHVPSDFDIREFLNSFFVSSDKDPTFLNRMGPQIVRLSDGEVIGSFLTHLNEEKSWLKPEYFTDLVNLIFNAADSHSSVAYRPLICALFGPSLYTEEVLPAFPVLVEVIEEFNLLRHDKISSEIAQAYVKLINSVQEKDRQVFLSMLPRLIGVSDDQSKGILRELLPKI